MNNSSMEKRFLKPLCERRACIIFQTALERFNYPTNPENIEEIREFCYKMLKGYNPVETEIMKNKIDELVIDYKSRLRDYAMTYR